MSRIEKRWDDLSKAAEFLESAAEWHHVSSGRREREASLLHSLTLGVQRIKPRPSIQPIIKYIFSPHFVRLKTQAMRQSETPLFIQFQKTKTRDFHTWNREIGIVLNLY